MHLFYYLYIVAVVIPYKLIKVMKLKAYLLSHKLEILFQYLTETLSENVTNIILDINGIIPGTGTTGCTIDGDFHSTIGNGIIFIGVIIIGGIAHLADRKLNQNLESELMDLEDQNQNRD